MNRATAEEVIRTFFVSRVSTHYGETCDGRKDVPPNSAKAAIEAGLAVRVRRRFGMVLELTPEGRAIRDAESARLRAL